MKLSTKEKYKSNGKHGFKTGRKLREENALEDSEEGSKSNFMAKPPALFICANIQAHGRQESSLSLRFILVMAYI